MARASQSAHRRARVRITGVRHWRCLADEGNPPMGFGKAGWVGRKAGLWDFWHHCWLVLEPPPAEAPHEAVDSSTSGVVRVGYVNAIHVFVIVRCCDGSC